MPRRQFLIDTRNGLGGIALLELLSNHGLIASEESPLGSAENLLGNAESNADKSPIRPSINPAQPHAARPAHFAAQAKNILVVFCCGATSQIDTFDYKPELIRRHGQPLPGGDELITFQGEQGNLTKSPWKFRPRGQCGKMISDLVPRLGALADEMCFIHSLTGKTNSHGPGENFMCTGYTLDGFPSMGAWVSYALGSENENLPAYVAIPDPRGTPQSSVNCWGPGFLPAAFQGTDFNAAQPIRHLARPPAIAEDTDRATRAFLERLNQHHLKQFPGDTDLAARIASYQLAAKMQLTVPQVADLSTEPQQILKMYGADAGGNRVNDLKAAYARNCILARRLTDVHGKVIHDVLA